MSFVKQIFFNTLIFKKPNLYLSTLLPDPYKNLRNLNRSFSSNTWEFLFQS